MLLYCILSFSIIYLLIYYFTIIYRAPSRRRLKRASLCCDAFQSPIAGKETEAETETETETEIKIEIEFVWIVLFIYLI